MLSINVRIVIKAFKLIWCCIHNNINSVDSINTCEKINAKNALNSVFLYAAKSKSNLSESKYKNDLR